MYEWIESVLLSYLLYDEYKIPSDQRLQTGLQTGGSGGEVRTGEAYITELAVLATNNPL